MNASMLVYDIPVVRRTASSGRTFLVTTFPNPSVRLRRAAVRVNLSTWIVPEGKEPWHLLDEMTKANVRWHLVKFDGSEAEKLADIARDVLRREVENAERRCEESLGRLDLVDKDYEAKANAIGKRCAKALRDLESCTQVFGFGSLKALAEARSAAYCDAAAQVRDEGLALAAKSDEVPHEVLADALEEQGEDTSIIRDAFKPAPKAKKPKAKKLVGK